MNWYYVERGQQAGPVGDEELDKLVHSGQIKADTLVWHEGMPAWAPYGEAGSGTAAANPSAAAAAPTPEAVCSECGRIFPIDETIRHGNVRVCAACKPVFLQKLQEGAALNTGELKYAGFGIRFGAAIIDGLILGVPFLILFILVMGASVREGPGPINLLPSLLQLGLVVVQVAYQTFFWGKYGATPGKMLCKLKVVTSDGNPISYARALGRAFGEMLSGMICYIGYIMVAFDNPQRRALHDHICNTRVVYR